MSRLLIPVFLAASLSACASAPPAPPHLPSIFRTMKLDLALIVKNALKRSGPVDTRSRYDGGVCSRFEPLLREFARCGVTGIQNIPVIRSENRPFCYLPKEELLIAMNETMEDAADDFLTEARARILVQVCPEYAAP